MMGQVWITATYAALLGILALVLANFVLFIRLKGKNRPAWQHEAALRVQANFVENVPLALVLMLIAELNGASEMLLVICGAGLVICRVLHAYGLGTIQAANYPRLIGAQGTFLLIATLAFSCLLTVL